MPRRSIVYSTFRSAFALAASSTGPAQQQGGKHHTLAATLDTVQCGWLDPNGPHSVTGPIYVEGAEPGDVLEVRIRKIVPKPFAVNFNLPGKDFPTIGALAPEMPDGFVRFMPLDLKTRTAKFKPGITIDLNLAV